MTESIKLHANFKMHIMRFKKIPETSMLLCGILFCFQMSHLVCSLDASQTYVAEVMIEGNASLDVSTYLSGIEMLHINDMTTIVEATMTGQCETIGAETTCWCAEGYIWSDIVCDSVSSCCNSYLCIGNISNYTPMCVPQANVSISGTITMLTVWNYESMLLTEFSKLNGFNSLTTTTDTSRQNFTVTLNATFKTAKLENIISLLKDTYSSNIINITATSQGLVNIEVPTRKVCYNSQYTINCSMEEEMEKCSWQITRPGQTPQIIGVGSEVNLLDSCTDRTEIGLINITWFWAGVYTCMFTNGSVTHTASAELNVALLPEVINITSTPPTLDCTVGPVTSFNVICAIDQSLENYVVTLSDQTPQQSVKNNIIMYNKTFTFNCKDHTPSETVVCKITNSVEQTRIINLTIPIIYPGDQFCEADDVWPKTKNGTQATILCTEPGRMGRVIRLCNGRDWGDAVSFCTKHELNVLSSTAGDFEKGVGATQEQANSIFDNLKNSTGTGNITYGDITASVSVFNTMSRASHRVTLDEALLPNFIESASNMLNESWNSGDETRDGNLASSYLSSVENLVHNIKLNASDGHNTSNIQLQVCRQSTVCNRSVFNVELELNSSASMVKTLGLQNIAQRLPQGSFEGSTFPSLVVSVTTENRTSPVNIRMAFSVASSGDSNTHLHCVFWNTTEEQWSEEGCNLTQGPGYSTYCECDHLTSFSMLMSRTPVNLPMSDQITYIGLGISICSLIVFILIEFLVWNAVVKSNLSHFRHTSLVNIAVCLLLADCSFIASSFNSILTDTLCLILVLAKHFFYLAMFYWMFCLSIMLIHQLIFVFHQVRKKVYMILSITIGYVCPTVTVGVTYIYYNKRTDVSYYSRNTCWLTYEGTLQGSIYAFLFPVGIIVFVNMFCMVVVIVTLLKPAAAESNKKDDKEAAKSIIKVIIFLTPVFGGTWVLGLFVFLMDNKSFASVLVNYTFIIVNSLQGFFILLTGCFGEKRVRDEIVKLVLSNNGAKSESKQKLTSSTAKK